LFLSEELRVLNNRLESSESNLRQAQTELKEAESKILVKDEDTKMTDVGSANTTASAAVQGIRGSNPLISTPTTEGLPTNTAYNVSLHTHS
jgi:hypothetical protein